MLYQATEQGVHYTLVWQNASQELMREVTTLWERQGVLPPGTSGGDRVRELMMIARGEQDELMGLSTCGLILVPEINEVMYNFRTFVTPSARRQYVTRYLSLHTFLAMQRWNEDPGRREAVGVYMEVENEHLKHARANAITSFGRNLFLGYTTAGHHRRIRYFANARM